VDEFLTVVTKKYADFNGRARRREYWMYALFYAIVAIGLYMIFGVIGAAVMRDGSGFALGGLGVTLLSLGLILPSLAVTVRRLHDIGRSGWWWLISFIPFGSLVLFIFTVLDSQPGDNQYGPNPKGIPGHPPVPETGLAP
jgi:uncharacterized membrane protein YhaH (DUF805 family)